MFTEPLTETEEPCKLTSDCWTNISSASVLVVTFEVVSDTMIWPSVQVAPLGQITTRETNVNIARIKTIFDRMYRKPKCYKQLPALGRRKGRRSATHLRWFDCGSTHRHRNRDCRWTSSPNSKGCNRQLMKNLSFGMVFALSRRSWGCTTRLGEGAIDIFHQRVALTGIHWRRSHGPASILHSLPTYTLALRPAGP